ncbi:hypothetical protein AF72_03255 [Xylella taiwanensis]|uniref:Uncharacterized protein n=1 Tax=Xylella taiwanensis TaxID=1444770 RepID=Z9JLS8_9GAMM|nr:hypothetical protein AB672_09605 [Xylella taiwanensis]EWS78933.1 hypothetical protein AF72_03255 [Xylella taiwanensis]
MLVTKWMIFVWDVTEEDEWLPELNSLLNACLEDGVYILLIYVACVVLRTKPLEVLRWRISSFPERCLLGNDLVQYPCLRC